MRIGRTLKIGLLVVVGLAAALGIVMVCSVVPVNDRPYVQADYYRSTRSRVDALKESPPAPPGELWAGFGRVLLTPPSDSDTPGSAPLRLDHVPLAGYGDRRGHPAIGSHDDLWVKAVAFQVGSNLAFLVSADALIIPAEIADAAADRVREFGVTRDQVYFGATHTHSGLGGWGEGWVAEAFAGPYQDSVRTWFSRRLAEAVRLARDDLGPARWGHGSFRATEFVRNRLVGDRGGIDDEFSLLVVEKRSGPRALLGAFAAHATVLPSQNLQFSGDYPGAWQRTVEARAGDLGLFLAGGVGSHSPRPPAPGFEGAEQMGQALAARSLDLVPRIPMTNHARLRMMTLTVDLPELHARLTDSWRLRPSLASKFLHTRPQTRLQVFRLDDCAWVSTPCDFSGELARSLKDYAAARALALTITSFNGDYIGYVVPAKYYHLPGYETRLMSFFGPSTADYLDDLIRRLLETSGSLALSTAR